MRFGPVRPQHREVRAPELSGVLRRVPLEDPDVAVLGVVTGPLGVREQAVVRPTVGRRRLVVVAVVLALCLSHLSPLEAVEAVGSLSVLVPEHGVERRFADGVRAVLTLVEQRPTVTGTVGVVDGDRLLVGPVDDLFGGDWWVTEPFLDGVPAALLLQVVDERRAVGVRLEDDEEDAEVEVTAAPAAARPRGLDALPLATALVQIEVLDVVRLTFDDAGDREVAVLGRASVGLTRQVVILVLECVDEFVVERRVVDDRLVGRVGDDLDLVVRRRVEPGDRRPERRPEFALDVLLLAGDEQPLPHLVVPGLEGGVRSRLVRRAFPVGLPRDDRHGDRLFELALTQMFDPRHRPRNVGLQLRIGETVGLVDVDGLVVPVAVLPADDVAVGVGRRTVLLDGGAVGDRNGCESGRDDERDETEGDEPSHTREWGRCVKYLARVCRFSRHGRSLSEAVPGTSGRGRTVFNELCDVSLVEYDSRTKIVLLDAFLAASTFLQYWLIRQFTTNDDWWITGVVALVTFGLLAAADRSRTGVWALGGAGLLAIAALVWVAATDAVRTFPLTWLMLGIAVAMAANRFVFGVVRPIPEARRRRTDTSSWVNE